MNIIKRRNIFFALSGLLIIVGLVVFFTSGLNLAIDFTGGTLMQIELDKTIEVPEIRQITDGFDKSAEIIHAGDNKSQIIIKTKEDLNNEKRQSVFNQFKEKYKLKDEAFLQSRKIGPSIGEEIKRRAVLSVVAATIGMLIYITIRFQFLYGLSAVIALLHDVLIAIAFYAVFKVPVNSSFVAAILTIVGYSINDTIVVFDRIRENLGKMRKESYDDIINTSISQTIVRSINTSFTTLIAISSLYIFGVEAVKDFALPLIIGIVVGTYSSIFIASPIWYIFKKGGHSKTKRA
ncbi:protein translocase subunit SecF [Clostridiaceae bacterium M8S5]|nr:protein translocase subunit SecF [Clostridiaceae bacterium M8S5]